MSKKTLLKGIIAVSAATTMLFSTAFAAEISSTRTLYVKGSTNTVEVATTVTGLTIGDEVTYLAGDASNPVYINQYTAADTTETFKYKTTKIGELASTTVKMAKADADFTNGQSIATDEEIADPEMFTFNVTVDGDAKDVIEVNPNSVGTTVKVAFALDAEKEIDTVTVDGVDAAYEPAADGITVTHGVIVEVNEETNDFDKKSANIVITTKDKEKEDIVYETPAFVQGFKAAEYTYAYTDDEGEKSITGPMYAVYANNANIPDSAEYGIALCDTKDGDFSKELCKALAADEDGAYAIAVIEENKETAPAVVYAKTYYKLGDEYKYSDDIITINVVKE